VLWTFCFGSTLTSTSNYFSFSLFFACLPLFVLHLRCLRSSRDRQLQHCTSQTHNHSFTHHCTRSWKVRHRAVKRRTDNPIISHSLSHCPFWILTFLGCLIHSVSGSSAHTENPLATSLIGSQRGLGNPPVAKAQHGHREVTDRL
jgi:hypothetical protein